MICLISPRKQKKTQASPTGNYKGDYKGIEIIIRTVKIDEKFKDKYGTAQRSCESDLMTKGSNFSHTTRATWVERFGSSQTLPISTRDRGACPFWHTHFRTDADAVLLLVQEILPRLSLATGFVVLSSERARCLLVYEVLKVFGKFSAGQLQLEASSVEDATGKNADEGESAINLFVEEPLKDQEQWGGNVEFLIKNRQHGTILLVVEVKTHFEDPNSIWQLLAELAIAAEHNGGSASGALTDGYLWRFCTVDKRSEKEFAVKMAADQLLFTQTIPLRVGDFTISAMNFFCSAIFPQRRSLSASDVKEAFTSVDESLQSQVSMAAHSFVELERERAEAAWSAVRELQSENNQLKRKLDSR